MSTYEWERGEIKIPTDQWKAFRENIIKAWNDWHLKMFRHAEEIHTWIKANKKRGEDIWGYQGTFNRAFDAVCKRSYLNDDDFESREKIARLLKKYDKDEKGWSVGSPRLQKPKKKDIGTRPLSNGGQLYVGGASISLNNKTKIVSYGVDENNHACDSARALPHVKAMFWELNRIKWKRGSGGSIVGNDEYNRESDYEGGGGNYAKETYGPKKKGERGDGLDSMRSLLRF